MSTDDQTFDDQSGAIPRVGDDPLRIVDESMLMRNNNNNTSDNNNTANQTGAGAADREVEQLHLTGVDINDVDIADLHMLAAAANEDDDDDDDDEDQEQQQQHRLQVGQDGDLEFSSGAGKKQKPPQRRGVMLDYGDGDGFLDADDGGAAAAAGLVMHGSDDDDAESDIAVDDDDDDDEEALGGDAAGGDDDDDDDDVTIVETKAGKDSSKKNSKKKPTAPWKPAFPEATIKKLLQVACPPPVTFTKDALRAVNRSVELIIQDLADMCARECQRRRSKQLTYDILSEVIARNDRFSFLADVVPLPTMGRLVQVAAGKHKKTDTAAAADADDGAAGKPGSKGKQLQQPPAGQPRLVFGNATAGAGAGSNIMLMTATQDGNSASKAVDVDAQ